MRAGDPVEYVQITTDTGLKAAGVKVLDYNWPFERERL